MPIENWTMSRDEVNKALELQQVIKDAGLSWPQVDILLDMKEGTVHEWCRAHNVMPHGMLERIKEVLDKVKAGKLREPILDKYTEA